MVMGGSRVRDYAEEADLLKPFILPWIAAAVGSGPSGFGAPGGGLEQHALNSSAHTGLLAQSQAPWAVTDSEFATHTNNTDLHHPRQHDILSGSDHTIDAPMWTLVGATAEDTLGGFTPSSDGRVERILKSSSAGGLRVETMTADTSVTTPVVASGGDLVLDPSTIYHQVRVDGILTGGFGSSSTSGTLDWNDISNARSGQAYSLLRGDHSNGPSVTANTYFHPFGFEYASKNGTGNITQLAIPYGYGQGINAGIWMRGRFLSSWTDWTRIISENTNGSVGINTISPSASYVLDVNGDTRISGDLDVDETVYADTSLETPLITTATDQDLLIDPAGNGLVLFPTSQTVGSVDFGSSFPIEGWRIYEFDGIMGKNGLTIGSISADELFIKYFVADETRIRRGQQYWTYSNGTLSRAFTTPTAIDGTVRLYFENSPQIDGAIFVSGDWLLVQYISNAGGGFVLQNIWGQVSDYATTGNGEEDGEQSWLFTLKAGLTEVEVGKGAEAIDFGQTGAALIQLSVVDAAGSPYIDMRRWAGSDPMSPSNHTSLVKIGDLDGISNSYVTPNGDGIYIRSGAAANQFILADDNGLQLRGADFSQYNSTSQTVLIESDDGSLTLGTDLSDPDQVGFAFDGTSGNVTIGNPNYTSTVTVYGQIYIANPDDIDTSDLTNDAGWTAGATWGSNIANQPSTLGDINSTEGTKLSGIAAGATVGATWGTNLGNIPDRFGEAPDDPGLYLTGTHLGYYDGSEWKAWMAATGEFYFGGSSGAHLQWSGRYLRGIGSGSTVQWFADSEDGVFYFGGGSGWLDSSGLAIETGSSSAGALANVNKVRWVADAESDPHFWIGATKTLATTEAVLWAEDPDGDTTQLTALAIAGATNNALVTLQASVGANSSQWIFSRLSSGSVFASFPGEIRVNDVKPQSNNGGNLGSSSLYYDHAYISNLHVATIVGTPEYSHSHSAGDITSGTLDLDLIPATLTGKSADFLDGLNSSDFALTGHSHAYLPLAGGQLTGNITFIGSQTVDGVDISAFYTAYSNHNHDTRYYTETESDARFVLKSGDTMSGALTAPAIKNALLSQPSQSGVDLSMVGYFDRNELIYSNLAGNVTVSITGAGTAYNTHYMIDGTGESSEINGTNATTTQIRITIDRGSGVSVYGRAQWQPFVAFRYLGFSQYTYYNHIVCEVSLDGVSWYKPSGGQWETSDAAGEASNGSVWMGSEALPTSLPSPYAWRYARFTLTDRVEGSSYPGVIWISQVGMRHVSAKFSQIWLDRAGDTMFGDFAVKSGSANVFDVDVSTSTTTATGLFNVAGDSSITGDLDIEDDLIVDGTITTSTVFSTSDLNLYTNSSVNRVFTNGLLTGGFGTAAASGTIDWNHSSNARSGQGYSLLLSTATSGPSRAGGIYFHPFGFEYSTKNGTGNITQLAIPYSYEAGINAGIWMRGRYNSSWTGWTRIISENTNGSVGINTTSPSSSYKLDVNGDSRVNGSLTVGSAIINAAAAGSSATFSHTSFNDTDSFALAQYATGATQLNAHAGQYLDLSINDETIFLVNSQRLLPRNSIEVDIGDYNRLVRSIFAAEVVAQTLVASEIYATVGGGIRVSPTTKLIADVGASDTTIDVEHNNLVSGEYVELRTAPLGLQQFEAMHVTSGPTTITGGYRYSVDRNLDGTGANNWLAGDAVVSMRTNAGEGWIEMTATSTVFNHLGPTTTYYARTDTTNWNDVVPVVTQGNMRSFVDYASDEFGAGIGNDLTLTPTSGLSGLTADRTNGLRLFNVDISLHNANPNRTVYITSEGDVKFGSDTYTAGGTSFYFNSSNATLLLGKTGENNPNLFWDGSVHLRVDETDVITFSSSGESFFSGPMSLGVGGGIYQGSAGTFASPNTGLKIWNNSVDGEVSLFDSGTKVVWMNGENGLNLAGNTLYSSLDVTRSLTFWNGSAIIGQLTSYIDSGGYGEGVELHAFSPNADSGSRRLSLAAVSDDDDAVVTLLASGSPGTVSVEMQASGLVTVAGAHINMSNKAITDLSAIEIGDDSLSMSYGKLKVAGVQASTLGPHQYFLTSQDSRPTMQLFNWQHDNIAINFDTYYNGGWYASDTTGAQIYKLNDALKIRGHSSSSPGSPVTMYDLVDIDISTGFAEFAGDVSIAGDLNIDGSVGETWTITGWSWGTGWANYGSYWSTFEYKTIGDIVLLRGLVKRTTGSATVIGTLPLGYRPATHEIHVVATNTGYGEITISPSTGEITLRVGGTGYVSLVDVSFSKDA